MSQHRGVARDHAREMQAETQRMMQRANADTRMQDAQSEGERKRVHYSAPRIRRFNSLPI